MAKTEPLSQENLESLLAEWQKILRLQDWQIKVSFARGHEIEGHQGRITIYLNFKQALIKLRNPIDWTDEDFPDDTEVDLVHELIHLHINTFDTTKPGTLERVALEQVDELLARALVGLNGGQMANKTMLAMRWPGLKGRQVNENTKSCVGLRMIDTCLGEKHCSGCTSATECIAELEKNRDEHVAAARIPFKHELIGPVHECGCAACNLHHKYNVKLTAMRTLVGELAAELKTPRSAAIQDKLLTKAEKMRVEIK